MPWGFNRRNGRCINPRSDVGRAKGDDGEYSQGMMVFVIGGGQKVD